MNIYALIPLISSFAYGALAIVVLRRHLTRVRQVFALYLVVAMTWSFTSFMLHANFFPEEALLWNKFLIVVFMWMAVVYYHFVRAFIDKPGGLGVYLGYLLLAILTVLTALGYVVSDVRVEDGILYHELGASLYGLTIFAFFFVAAAAFFLVQRYKGLIDPLDRRRIIYLLTALAIVVIFGFTNHIPSLAKYPVDHIGNFVAALVITYAIMRYQLLDIRFVARRGLAYSSLTIFLAALYLILLLLLQQWFDISTGYTTLAAALGVALLISVLFHPLRNLAKEWVDRLFYRETYDYRQMLLTFSNKVSNVLDLSELAGSMLHPITRAMRATQASLLLPDAESGDFTTRFSQQTSAGQPLAKLRLSSDNPIVIWLTREGKPFTPDLLDIIPEFKGLWKAEKDELGTTGIELLCPVRSKGNLVGILALGKKLSGTPYSNEDIDLLMTMATEAAIAIENAKLLDSLKTQQHRVEQLLARTVLAQEEERKRISVELHDSIAQWLVSASYRVQACNSLLAKSNNDNVSSELKEIEDIIDQSLKELRRVMAGLHPPALAELGLVHTLKRTLEQLEADGIACQFETSGTPVRLPLGIEIAIFRIVQEALTNIRKHADATAVNLSLRFQQANVLVEINDDGKGFNLAQTMDGAVSVGHMGLLGMKQRAETAGGTLRIETSPDAGTSVKLRVPVASD